MAEILRPNLCVLGAGAGGVAAAYLAAAAGASVVVVEKRPFDDGQPSDRLNGQMNGQVNFALLAHILIDAARRVAARQSDAVLGLSPFKSTVEVAALRARAQRLAKRLALDSPAKFAALKITTVQGTGRFTSNRRLEAAGQIIEADKFIIAAGATPPLPPAIKGLELVRPLDLEALLRLDRWPRRLVLIGGSAHGLALAQAFRRLGSDVHVFEAGNFLAGEDSELVAPILTRLRRDNVVLHERSEVVQVEPHTAGLRLSAAGAGTSFRLEASYIMLTATPVPLVEGLGLAEAGVIYDNNGIKVGADLRTSNSRIYALGDVLGGMQSLAMSRAQAHRIVAQLFEKSRVKAAPAPRIVFTDPELAVIGLSEAEARQAGRKIRVFRARFYDNMAAQIAGPCDGHVKIVTDANGRLLGAGIAGQQARELIALFGLALSQGLRVDDLRGFLPASPSFTEAGRLAALALPAQLGKALWRRIFPLPRRFR
jgi:pyruvate/2-oxoglutarate dehydrogenase complex dihydrolipoamide dehydrogenase (E3) component